MCLVNSASPARHCPSFLPVIRRRPGRLRLPPEPALMPARRCGICSAVGHNRQTCRSSKTTAEAPLTEAPLTPRRPSQAVSETESKALSPEGNHIKITMERVSTGSTRYAAQFKRSSAGAMNDAERREKARVRASLFSREKRAESLRTDAERKHTSRTSFTCTRRKATNGGSLLTS